MDWLLHFLPGGLVGQEEALLRAIPRAVIAASTLAIAIATIVFLVKRRDLPGVYKRVAIAFVLLMLCVMLAYGIGTYSLFWPSPYYQRVFDSVAAVIALVAVFLIRFALPELLALPSPRQLERNNLHLKSEIDAHIDTMRELTEIRSDLEEKVRDRTLELKEINQRFEAALSGSDIAVFTQDRDLVFTWAYNNPHFEIGSDQVVGKTDADLFPGDVAGEVVAAKRAVLASGQGATLNVVVATTDGGSQYLRLSIEPLRDGDTIGLTSAVVDLTERHDYETRLHALTTSLAQANARFDLALRGSAIMVFSHDADLRYNWIYNPATGLSPDDMLGRTDEEFWPSEVGKPIIAMKREAMVSGQPQLGEIIMPLAGSDRHFQVRIEPILAADHAIVGLAGVVVDVTETHLQEKHLRLVMRELTHRSKNLLAVIQAMARQTAARSDDPQTFVARFSARLRAMAASHDLLVAQEWHGAILHDLVNAQIGQAIDPGSEQLKVDGPFISLRPDAAQNIGLALHELTTNASKYGALSVPGGRIALQWSIRDGERFHMRWEETKGPDVTQPEKTGFGVTLLERSVGQALDGDVKLAFTPSGVVCDIDIPASHVIA
jgi:PAS domain S-box-containing protein